MCFCVFLRIILRRIPHHTEIPQRDRADKISISTNSQSAVKARDLRSNDKRVLAIKKAFEKQNFRLVPNASLDEASAWLSGEIASWKKINDEVKIEVVE